MRRDQRRPGYGLIGTSLLLLWVAGGLQMGLAPWMSLWGVGPDFLVIALAALATVSSRGQAATFGFFAGLFQGAAAGANLAHYVVSRVLTGFLTAWANELRLQPSALVGFSTVALATVFARLVLLFLAPTPALTQYLGATMGSAMYNGVLAIPVYALLNKGFDSARRSGR